MSHPIIFEFTTEFEHQYIDAVKNSFNKALNCESKLPPWILNIQGMSGKKYRHFINNLFSSILNCRYLEIGSWKGSTLCSAIFNNRISSDIKCELIDGWHGEFSDWHNGYYIAVIKKEN